MSAAKYNLKVDRGSNFSMVFTLRNPAGTLIDLSGYSARMKVKEFYNSPTNLLSLTSSSGLTLGGTAGTVAVNLTDIQTRDLNCVSAVYDLEIVSGGGQVTRILEGMVLVAPEVTT